MCSSGTCARINSKLVRLEGFPAVMGYNKPYAFQFQTGAIKRLEDE